MTILVGYESFLLSVVVVFISACWWWCEEESTQIASGLKQEVSIACYHLQFVQSTELDLYFAYILFLG
jgi:hypothetical protein